MAKKQSLRGLTQELNAEQLQDWAGWIAEIKTSSDRAAALLGTTLLDELLAALLRGAFVDEAAIANRDYRPSATLFGPDRPLSSFSAKIALAYALGLLPTDLYEDL